MSIYKGRRSLGKIDRLPFKLRMEVEQRLMKGQTYKKVSEWLKSLGHDISFMSVYRYGKPFLVKFEAVKKAKVKAEYLIDINNGNQ